MIATLPPAVMLRLAQAAGIDLRVAEPGEHAPLYAWATQKEGGTPGAVLYIGKAASNRRHIEEQVWSQLDPHGDTITAGFVDVMRPNRAKSWPLSIDMTPDGHVAVDPDRIGVILDGLDQWTGGPTEQALRERMVQPWTTADVEYFLIRLAVHCGAILANSSGAGMWEGAIGDPRDALAVAVADSVRATDIPPEQEDWA